MASSTTMPSTRIRAAIETWCSCTPIRFITPTVESIVTGMAMAAMRATRMGSSTMVTSTTQAMAIRNSWPMPAMRSCTTLGWLAMKSSFRSGGSRGRSSVKTLATRSPISTMLFPFCISTEIITAGLPSWRTRNSGSWYRRSTFARSPT